MNWKAEFSKAGELALRCGTLIASGWGVSIMGKGLGAASAAPGKFGAEDLIFVGFWTLFLTLLFLGCFRRNKACAVMAAFMLGFLGAGEIGTWWGGYFLDGLEYMSVGDLTAATYCGVLICGLGLLLLTRRFSRTALSPALYVLFSVLATLPGMVTDDWR